MLKPNAPNIIVPPDEIENAMAPSNLKKRKKGTRQSKLVVTETSGPTAVGPTPVLHVTEHGRFGLQDYPLPSVYVGSKLLQTDQTACGPHNPPQLDSTPHVESLVSARTFVSPAVQAPQSDVRVCAVQPSAHLIKPSARPVKPSTTHPVKPSARPVKPSARPAEPSAHPVERPGAHTDFGHSRSRSFTPNINSHSQQEPSTWQVLPGGSASSVHPNSIVDGSDDETEQTQTDGEMVVEEDFDVEETLDASFEEDSHEEDANFEEDDIDVAISGEEQEDGNDNLCMTSRKHINNEGRKPAGQPQTNGKQAFSCATEVPNINYDLLQRHHSNNHRPHSPSPSYLIGVHGQHNNPHPKSKCPRTNKPSPANHLQGLDCDDDKVKFDCDSGVHSHTTKKNKNGKGTANPTTLGFFPPLWVKLLDFAKANFRQHLTIVAPFPQPIVYWQEQKHQLEKGYYPNFKAEMAIVIFNDAATFRSKIKHVALAVVPLEYELISQGSSIATIKSKASGLIHHSLFLCGVADAQGHSSNFAHNALRSICLRVFYDSGSKSLCQFPAFRKTIPDNAIILIATIVRNVLDIYSRHGQANTKQTNIIDSEIIYKKIAGLFKRVSDDEYHGPKLHKMLQS
ncbi:uncharacterized protein F5147DRAFT_771274 [Suillus discolor]|uniref:DUF6532 domain-containing protein n=1 Tax=Suillus discolor TaxID=1912936 RepID=A0A9P7FBS8_9AGAM|nr:uncharacterized protein F5147DRAFT_771274 [Suillus discolor]KAG2112210.1 hypothetical protein F5147DRAFT_771274 [Suillus discolor]